MKSFDDDTVIHPLKYEREVALIWGPLTDHSTALFSYAYGYRVCLSVSVGSINSGNVNRFLAGISQQYPPWRSLLLLELAKSPHFSSGNCNLPSFSHEALLGKEWMMQYNMYSMLSRSCNNVTYPMSVRKWMCHQRYCFSVKHGTSCSESHDFRSSHVRSASCTLTCFREFMLHKIDFQFRVDRDEGANQSMWNHMYNKLRQFFERHGHCRVTRVGNSKLYGWIRMQKAVLMSDNPALSTVKKQRLNLMKKLGSNF